MIQDGREDYRHDQRVLLRHDDDCHRSSSGDHHELVSIFHPSLAMASFPRCSANLSLAIACSCSIKGGF